MNAFHISSFAPSRAKGAEKVQPEDFDLYCAALSALSWRKLNGKITLCCDNPYAEFYEKSGLTDIWDEIRVNVADDLEGIDPVMFWAGGKLLALRDMNAPCVMIDTDFIVWKKLSFGREIIAAHREDITDTYPPISFFAAKNHILPCFSETVLPLNTAFLYVPDNDFRNFYTSQAISFMKSAESCGDSLRYMVFAEQRLVAMCADYTDTPVKTLLDKDSLHFPQSDFTHLWGAKQAMRDNPALRTELVGKCRDRIKRDFPEYSYIADNIDAVCAE